MVDRRALPADFFSHGRILFSPARRARRNTKNKAKASKTGAPDGPAAAAAAKTPTKASAVAVKAPGAGRPTAAMEGVEAGRASRRAR